MKNNESGLVVAGGGNLVATIDQGGLGAIIQPLIREIHLFDTFIAGTSHLKDPMVLEGIRVDDDLTLRREDNKFDSNAILVLNAQQEKLGYIPEHDNLIFARLMDAGKMLKAKIKKIKHKGGFCQITIGIYLVDF